MPTGRIKGYKNLSRRELYLNKIVGNPLALTHMAKSKQYRLRVANIVGEQGMEKIHKSYFDLRATPGIGGLGGVENLQGLSKGKLALARGGFPFGRSHSADLFQSSHGWQPSGMWDTFPGGVPPTDLNYVKSLERTLEGGGIFPRTGIDYNQIPSEIYTGEPYRVGMGSTVLSELSELKHESKLTGLIDAGSGESTLGRLVKYKNLMKEYQGIDISAYPDDPIRSALAWETSRVAAFDMEFDPRTGGMIPSRHARSMRNYVRGKMGQPDMPAAIGRTGPYGIYSNLGIESYSDEYLYGLGFARKKDYLYYAQHSGRKIGPSDMGKHIARVKTEWQEPSVVEGITKDYTENIPSRHLGKITGYEHGMQITDPADLAPDVLTDPLKGHFGREYFRHGKARYGKRFRYEHQRLKKSAVHDLFSKAAAIDEMSGIRRFDDPTGKKLVGIESVPANAFFDIKQKGSWVVGRGVEDIQIMRPDAVLEWGKQRFGQTKYLRNIKTGRALTLGSRYIQRLNEMDVSSTMGLFSGIPLGDKKKAFLEMRKRVMGGIGKIGSDPLSVSLIAKGALQPDVDLAAIYEMKKKLETVSGGIGISTSRLWAKNFNLSPFLLKKLRTSKDFKEFLRNVKGAPGFIDKYAAGDIIKGRKAQISNIELAHEGARYRAGKQIYETAAIGDRPLFTVVNKATRRPILFERMLAKLKGEQSPYMYAPSSIPIRFIRTQETIGGKYIPDYTRIATLKGDILGGIDPSQSELFSKITKTTGVESGILPQIEGYSARFYPTMRKNRLLWRMGIFRGDEPFMPIEELKKGVSSGGALAPSFRAVGAGEYQTTIGKIMRKEHIVNLEGMANAENITKGLHKKFPIRLYSEASKSRVTEDLLAAAQKGQMKKGILIGAAATIGAMMFLRATSSSKQKPLDPRDMPMSLYGDQSPISQALSINPMTRPIARIIPNNRVPEYSYNISMDANDSNIRDNYQDIAGIMSRYSSEALNMATPNVNLNVMDRSSSMNPYNMQRKFAEYMSR